MSRNLIYLCMCTHLVRLPNQPDKFICQPCIQRQNLFQTDGSGDFGESSHSGVSGDWYSMVFYSPELHWYHKSDPEWNITFKIYKYFYLDWEKYSWTEGTKILTHSSQLKIVHDGGKYSRIWLFNPQLSNSNSQESCLPGRAQAGERVPGQGLAHLPFLSPGGGRLWPLAGQGGVAPLDPHVLLRHPVRHDGLDEHGAEGALLQGQRHLHLLWHHLPPQFQVCLLYFSITWLLQKF